MQLYVVGTADTVLIREVSFIQSVHYREVPSYPFAVVDCGDPGSPNDGVHRVFSTTFGSVAHYECDSRFRLVGMEQRICQPNGQWSGSLPSCVLIDCGTPEEPQNGLALLRNGTTLGARATYQCKVGFKLSSTAARICLAGEVWSGTVPSCTCERHQQSDLSLHYVNVPLYV